MATNKDDLILVSVDDHIGEPADMFDAHVPEKYRERAPRVVDEPNGAQQWYYGDIRGRNLGLNAVAGQAAGDVQRQPEPLRGHAPRLLRRRRAGARHVGRAASSPG